MVPFTNSFLIIFLLNGCWLVFADPGGQEHVIHKIHIPTKIRTIYHTKFIKVPEHHHYIKEKPKLVHVPEHHHYFHNEKNNEKHPVKYDHELNLGEIGYGLSGDESGHKHNIETGYGGGDLGGVGQHYDEGADGYNYDAPSEHRSGSRSGGSGHKVFKKHTQAKLSVTSTKRARNQRVYKVEQRKSAVRK